MKQEDKDLLLKDLCARLSYGVKVRYSSCNKFITCTLHSINPVYNIVDLWSKDACFNPVGIDKIKPYLFPLSSITEGQKYTCPIGVANLDTFIKNESWAYLEITPDSILCLIDWLNKNHFDYRGLIKKGLAIDATGLNIY